MKSKTKAFSDINKSELLEETLKKLKQQLELLVSAAFEAKEASTNPESKAENKYDTRGLEASYLAAGQAQRATELQKNIFNLEQVKLEDLSSKPIRVSALVHLRINDEENKYFFVLPIGGVLLVQQGLDIQTLTLEAPLGRRLLNKSKGDGFDFKEKEYEILEVR